MLVGRIRIVPDEFGTNPRTDCYFGSVLLTFHKRYDFTDTNAPKINPADYAGWASMRAALVKSENIAVILPVYMYDHGGQSVSTEPFNCPWDSGQLGWIYLRRDKLADYGIKRLTKAARARLEKMLRSEIDLLDTYLTDGCYGFVAEERVQSVWEEVDSCYGFVGRDIDKNGMKDYLSGWLGEGYEIVEAE